jgi:hypothetical protein
MTVITRRKRCPSCGDNDFSRKHRTLWMRWFKGSRLYQCRRCRRRILLLSGGDDGIEDAEYPDAEFQGGGERE